MAGLDIDVIKERKYFFINEASVYAGLAPKTLRSYKSAGHPLMARSWNGHNNRVCIPVEDVQAFIDEELAMQGDKP